VLSFTTLLNEGEMKKFKWIVGLFSIVLLGGTLGFSLTAPHIQKITLQEAAPQEVLRKQPELPATVVYSAFFHFVADMQQQAKELESKGEKGESLRTYVQAQSGLNDEEIRKLNNIASTCVEEVAQQDAKASAIIQVFRSQFPGGKIPAGVKPPPPPPQLKELQQGRDQIILDARSKLAGVLGETGFNKVTAFIGKRIEPGIKPVQVN
jgi:hypothetical protein